MSTQMDEIDKKQQEEIDELQKVNERQDKLMSRLILAFSLIYVVLFVAQLITIDQAHKMSKVSETITSQLIDIIKNDISRSNK